MAAGVAAGVLVGTPGSARGQSALVLSGGLEFDYRLDRTTSVGTRSSEDGFGHRYSLSLDGVILDPRLATFSLGGAFGETTTDFTTGETSSATLEPYRISLSLLPAGLVSLSLRASRSEYRSSTETDVEPLLRRQDTFETADEYGATIRLRERGPLPEVTLDVRRTERRVDQPGPDVDETTWAASLAARKRLGRHDLLLDYQFEHRDTSVPTQGGDRHSVRLEDRVALGTRGTLSAVLDYRLVGDTQSGQAALSVLGPLGDRTDGSATLSYGLARAADTTTDTVAGSGSLSHRLTPRLFLTGSAFGLVTRSDTRDQWTVGGQTGATYAPWDPLRLSGSYGYTMFRTAGEGSSTQTASAGASTTLIPLTTVFGDATYARTDLESGRSRDRLSARLGADATPAAWLVLRGETEYFTEHSTLEAGFEESGYTLKGDLTVQPLYWLSATLAGTWTDRERFPQGRAQTLSGLGRIQVQLGRLAAVLEGIWERDDLDDRTRQGLKASLTYQLGLWQLSVDYARDHTDFRGGAQEREAIALRVSRPFRFRLL